MNNFIFSILLKQQNKAWKPIKPKVYGHSKAKTGRHDATN
jgi:hypothetical protein